MGKSWAKAYRRVLISAAVVVSLSLAGCADLPAQVAAQIHPPALSSTGQPNDGEQPSALDRYVAADQATIPTLVASSKGVFSAIAIDSSPPASIVFTYTYAKQIDPAKAAQYFDDHDSTLQTDCDNKLFPAMKKAGVTGALHAIYTYVDADGSQIWTKDFTASSE